MLLKAMVVRDKFVEFGLVKHLRFHVKVLFKFNFITSGAVSDGSAHICTILMYDSSVKPSCRSPRCCTRKWRCKQTLTP